MGHSGTHFKPNERDSSGEEDTINLTESELMEWIEDGEFLRLTDAGIEDVGSVILATEEASE